MIELGGGWSAKLAKPTWGNAPIRNNPISRQAAHNFELVLFICLLFVVFDFVASRKCIALLRQPAEASSLDWRHNLLRAVGLYQHPRAVSVNNDSRTVGKGSNPGTK